MGRKSSRLSENSPAQLSPGSASSLLRKTRRKNEVSSLANYSHQHGAPSSAGDEETTSVAQVSAENRTTKKKGDRLRGRGRNNETMLHFAIGLVLGLAYFLFISKHFQTLTNFSMLTNLEKELSLPTDTAFRYSFFKRIGGGGEDTKATLLAGLRSVIYDTRSNSPQVTNSVRQHGLVADVGSPLLGLLLLG
ncbi:hypothetical protein Fcan01_13600 [Folsomia candida]|uniref:Uncharacterized protein n=1 Tax=Folsomia candida TaxID=158441 RepID=A0A226E5I9_FOLCA|nr:hypothetical protein Fcan01_13600 [Folsomia candida]